MGSGAFQNPSAFGGRVTDTLNTICPPLSHPPPHPNRSLGQRPLTFFSIYVNSDLIILEICPMSPVCPSERVDLLPTTKPPSPNCCHTPIHYAWSCSLANPKSVFLCPDLVSKNFNTSVCLTALCFKAAPARVFGSWNAYFYYFPIFESLPGLLLPVECTFPSLCSKFILQNLAGRFPPPENILHAADGATLLSPL